MSTQPKCSRKNKAILFTILHVMLVLYTANYELDFVSAISQAIGSQILVIISLILLFTGVLKNKAIAWIFVTLQILSTAGSEMAIANYDTSLVSIFFALASGYMMNILYVLSVIYLTKYNQEITEKKGHDENDIENFEDTNETD